MEEEQFINSITFEEFLNGEVLILQCMGLSYFNRVFSNSEEIEKWWEKIIPFCGILIVCLSTYLELIRVIRVIDVDFTHAIDILSAMSSGMLCTFKAIRCWTHRKELFDFLRQLKTLWDSADSNKYISEDILNIVIYARSFRNYLTIIVIALAVSYAIPAYTVLGSHLIFHRDEYFFNFSMIMFPVTYPFTINSYSIYFSCLLFEQLVELLAIPYWLCGEVLFVQLTTHVGAQCTILVNRLRGINKDGSGSDNHENHRQLADIISIHHKLYLHYCWLQRFFNPILFFVTLVNGANLCFSLYRVDGEINERNWDILLSKVLYLVAVLGQTFLFCKHADVLTEKLDEISYAAYHCDWTHCDKTFKTMMLMIIKRAQNGYRFTTYGIITLDVMEFTKIVNAAMSYFAILRSFG
ncbi:odorant receptor 67c-like isoform X2 [Microplitis mediator]|nr:odorant receptor 67c-like isoform X2 [Microplitis mediator]